MINNNFGWPISSYGEHYPKMASKDAYEKAPLHKSHSKYEFVEFVKYFVPLIGISQVLKVENSFGQSENKDNFYNFKDNSFVRNFITLDFKMIYETNNYKVYQPNNSF